MEIKKGRQNLKKACINLSEQQCINLSERYSLKRYSYYWLNPASELKVGWDNAPHHTQLENFPHHKHIGQQENMQPSTEVNLEEVMVVILSEI